ncbi:hypothetical protein HQ520_07965 [bacterium]|nr:hypothetical protein [bacterium]
MVYVVESIHQEARSFVTSQKGRTAISAIEQYTADIVAKDPVAIAIGEMLSRLGLSADDSKKPNSVAFIYAIRNSFERDHFSCEQSLGLTHQICREHLASVGIFEGIFFCALHATENIFTPQYINKLCLAGKAQITQSINARRALHSMSGSSQRVSGTGVLDILNYKKRNKIGFKD